MTPLLTTFAGILSDANVGVLGRDLFVYYMPPEIEIGVVLLNSLVAPKIDPILPGFREHDFQVVVRHVRRDLGFQLCDRVIDALNIELVQYRDNVRINYILPNYAPISFPRLRSNVFEFSMSFNYCVVIKD